MLLKNTLELIGNTPLVKLENISKETGVNIYAKIEKNNLSGSIKDRAALMMLKDLLDSGKIKKGDTIIEETSGNTGIGLACLSNLFGLNCIIVMPKSASIERRNLIASYNAKLVLVDGGMKECVYKANELQKDIEGSIIIGQFDNKSNPKAHYETTAKEIEKDLPEVDAIFAGIGTGGTITGIASYFKNKNVKIYGIEPESSPLLTKGYASSHKIQGIGANFVPSILDLSNIEKIIDIKDEDAINTAKKLVKDEGLFVGISSGACLCGILKSKDELKGKNVVCIFPDSGERYSWN